MNRPIITSLFFLLLCGPVHATNYYLSNAGDDTANGQSPATAWESITRLQQEIPSITGGDTVFFRRGDIFWGQLDLSIQGSANNPIVFTAYESGADPIITASKAITNWTQIPGTQIWEANAPDDTIAYLFVNQYRHTLARYPNTGYVYTTSGGLKTELTSTALPGGTNYWQGATVRMRTSRWTYEFRRITSSTAGGKLIFDEETQYTVDPNWGFFIDNHYSELDMPGEWFYDDSNGKVYFWPPNNYNPNTLSIEGSSLPYGFYQVPTKALKHYVVDGLVFRNQYLEGLRFSSSKTDYVHIRNCSFYRQGETGVLVAGKNLAITDNYFEGQLGRGIKGNTMTNGEIRNNILMDIGLLEGYGYSGNQNMTAIHLTHSDSLYVGYNQIDSVGYTGISCYLGYSTVERNIINHSNLRLDDGGAIYAWGTQSHHILIQDNFIYDAPGYPIGTDKPDKYAANGIYMDAKVTYNTIRNNTVVGVANAGIYINSGNHDHTVDDNTIMDFDGQGIRLMDIQQPGTHLDNTYNGNVCYSFGVGYYPVTIFSLTNTEMDLGVFTDNYFINPYEYYVVNMGSYQTQRGHTLEEWEFIYPWEASNNHDSPFQFTGYHIIDDLTPNLVDNGTFDVNMDDWVYTINPNVNSGWVTNVGLDSGAAEMHLLNGNITNGTISADLNQDLSQGSYYHLEYSIISQDFGTIEVLIWTQNKTIIHKFIRPYTPTRRDQKLVFQMPQNVPNAKLGFRQKYNKGQHFIIDNVSLKEVSVLSEQPQDKVELFSNPTTDSVTVPLSGNYFDMDGNPVFGSIDLNPYSSRLLFRLDSVTITNIPPQALISASITNGPAPLSVVFSGTDSEDPDGIIVDYSWDFGQGDSSNNPTDSIVFTNPGNYTVRLAVMDNGGLPDTAYQNILVTAPGPDSCFLSSNWTSTDLGPTGTPGEACEDSLTGALHIYAAGEQIFYKYDRCHFLYQNMDGDGIITMRIDSIDPVNPNTMSGIMIRESLGGGSKNIFMGLNAEGQWLSQIRSVNAKATQRSSCPPGTISLPHYVRVLRLGDIFKTYHSADGANWQIVETYNLDMDTTSFVGIATASYADPMITTVRIDSFSISSDVPPYPGGNPCDLPAGWNNIDLGAVGTPGKVCEDSLSGMMLIKASGVQIGDKWDQGHFVYHPVSGDCSISARILSLSPTTPFVKAGLTIRQDLASNTKNAFMGMNIQEQWLFQVRKQFSATTIVSSSPPASFSLGQYLKLTRNGNTFSGYISTDGINWQLVGTQSFNFPQNVYIGIAVASYDQYDTTMAIFDQITTSFPSLIGSRESSISNSFDPMPAMQIYPNPVSGPYATIEFQGYAYEDIEQILLLDLTGRRIATFPAVGEKFKWKIPDGLPAGQYVLLAKHRQGTLRSRFIWQP